jgi:acarbose 7IV-phosphotransferase
MRGPAVSELGALDVLVGGGTGVDHIVRVPLLPLPVRDSMTIPPIQSVVVSHPSGTRRAVNLVTPEGSRMSLYDPRPPVDLAGDRSLWRDGIGRARQRIPASSTRRRSVDCSAEPTRALFE